MRLLAIINGAQNNLSCEMWDSLVGGEYGVVFKDKDTGEVIMSRRYRLQMAAMRDALAFVSGDMTPRLIDFETAARHCA